MKKLSVITVTYNCLGLINKTLKSVAAQDRELVEHIVIDGNSTDGTAEFLLSNRSQLTHLVSEPDKGIFDAMNKGIKAATGSWLLFLNAGDVFHEDFKLTRADFSWHEGVEFVFYAFQIGESPTPCMPDINRRFGMPTSHQAMLISTPVAKLAKFDSRYKVAADFDLYLRRMRANSANPRFAVTESTVISRVEPGGFSYANVKTMVQEYQRIIQINLGWRKALTYFFWARPRLFKTIKSLLPLAVFVRLKKGL